MPKRYLEINEDTGETREIIGEVVEKGSGDRIIRENSLKYLTKRNYSKEEKTDFVWVKFKYNTPFYPNIQDSNITRMIYFSTFCNHKGFVMYNIDIKSMLCINPNQLKDFRKDLLSHKIYYIDKDNDKLYINNNCFSKGSIEEPEMDYLRLFTKTTQKLYSSCKTTEHKQLSYIFRMIPYVNRQTNILSCNQKEQELIDVEYLQFKEFCNIIGYDSKHLSRLRSSLLNYRIDGELVVGFFDSITELKNTGKYVVVNPKLFYGGDKNNKNYARICKLFKSKEATNFIT